MVFGRDKKTSSPSALSTSKSQRPMPSAAGATVLANTVIFTGELSGSGDVRIEGQLSGSVDCDGHVLIAGSGKVDASLHAREVTIAGKFKGEITADERIELKPSADLEGVITAPRVLIQDGATFEGEVHMQSPKAKATNGKAAQDGKPVVMPDKPKKDQSKAAGKR